MWFHVIDFVSCFQNFIKCYYRDAFYKENHVININNLRVVWCKS
jgi:hypothetical protein